MDNTITIQKENILKAYNQASGEQKELLENIFGKTIFQSPDIKERVKTFTDAVLVLGTDNQSVIDYREIADATFADDILAFAKLKVIVEALNEGWKPKFDGEERRYYPWFYIYSKDEYDALSGDEKKKCRAFDRSFNFSIANGGVSYAYTSHSELSSTSYGGTRLALKTRELAEYCGRQFIDIWMNYLFA